MFATVISCPINETLTQSERVRDNVSNTSCLSMIEKNSTALEKDESVTAFKLDYKGDIYSQQLNRLRRQKERIV